jgi:carbon monoxide dehydrogenase subunit G
MTTFESEIKKVECDDKVIFDTLSNLNNLEKIIDRIPRDKIKDLEYDCDSCSFSVDPVGKVGLRIVDREPCKTIKFGADNAPVDFNLWLQVKQVAENDSRIKVTMKAELPMMLKMMASKPLTEFVNKLAEALSQLPYKSI